MNPVFISYSHDSDVYRDRVLSLSERLRDDGIDTRLDQYVNGCPAEGWPRWMLDRLDEVGHVLVVCTETYYHRFRGHEVPDKGKGVLRPGSASSWAGMVVFLLRRAMWTPAWIRRWIRGLPECGGHTGITQDRAASWFIAATLRRP